MEWLWHQLDCIQITYTSLCTDNHAITSSLIFPRPNVVPDVQPTVSNHWRQHDHSGHTDELLLNYWAGWDAAWNEVGISQGHMVLEQGLDPMVKVRLVNWYCYCRNPHSAPNPEIIPACTTVNAFCTWSKVTEEELDNRDWPGNYHYYSRFTALCPALSGWAATRRNIHPLTYPDLHPTLISFFHLLWSIASSLLNLYSWQSFCTTSLQVLFGLPLGLEPFTSYCIHFFTQSVSPFRNTCPYHRSLFCCSTKIISSVPSLSLNSLLGTLSFTLTLCSYLTRFTWKMAVRCCVVLLNFQTQILCSCVADLKMAILECRARENLTKRQQWLCVMVLECIVLCSLWLTVCIVFSYSKWITVHCLSSCVCSTVSYVPFSITCK